MRPGDAHAVVAPAPHLGHANPVSRATTRILVAARRPPPAARWPGREDSTLDRCKIESGLSFELERRYCGVMFRRVAIVAIGLLAVAGGAAALSWRQDVEFANCQNRATSLETIPLLVGRPDGVQPDSLYSGCDVDRLVAYAGRQYHGGVDEQAIVSFYQQLAKKEAWLVTPAGAGRAKLCASKDFGGGMVYMNLSFPMPGTFDVHLANSPDSGAQCVTQDN
jgi:hypothetical protein